MAWVIESETGAHGTSARGVMLSGPAGGVSREQVALRHQWMVTPRSSGESSTGYLAGGPTKETVMTGPSRRPQTRPLDAGHRHAPFPGADVLRRRPRAQTACPCRSLAVGSRSPGAAKSRFGSARRPGRPQRPHTPRLRGGLVSIRCRVVALQHGGTGSCALLVFRPLQRRHAVGTLVTTTPLLAG